MVKSDELLAWLVIKVQNGSNDVMTQVAGAAWLAMCGIESAFPTPALTGTALHDAIVRICGAAIQDAVNKHELLARDDGSLSTAVANWQTPPTFSCGVCRRHGSSHLA